MLHVFVKLATQKQLIVEHNHECKKAKSINKNVVDNKTKIWILQKCFAWCNIYKPWNEQNSKQNQGNL